jgi:hypothetical protein
VVRGERVAEGGGGGGGGGRREEVAGGAEGGGGGGGVDCLTSEFPVCDATLEREGGGRLRGVVVLGAVVAASRE